MPSSHSIFAAWFRVASALLPCLSLGGCGSAKPPAPATLEDLVQRHTQARGGRSAIEAIENLEARLRIAEPTFTAEGTWQVDRKGRMHIDVFVDGKRVWSEAFDGKVAWDMPGDAEHGTEAKAGASALRHSAQLPTNLLGLHEMESHGHKLEYSGREGIDGTDYHVILLTLDDGFTTRCYLDPVSFLITRARVSKALHPDADPTPMTIETVYSDFRPIAGVQFAFHARDTELTTNKLLQTTELLDLKANPPLDEQIFKMP
jgi:hypothetical protein